MFCFQAEDGIRDLVRSRGLGDVYKRQLEGLDRTGNHRRGGNGVQTVVITQIVDVRNAVQAVSYTHLTLPTSDLV